MEDNTPNPLQRVLSFLRGYFFIEGSPLPLGLFRIALGLTVMYEAFHNFRRILYYTPETYHFPYVGFIKPLPIGELARRTVVNDLPWAAVKELPVWPDSIEMIFAWQLVFGAMLAIGLFTRIGALGILLTQGYSLFICQLNFRNHIYLMLLMVVLALFSPAGKSLSVGHAFKLFQIWLFPDKARDGPVWVPLITQRLVVLQIAIMYFWAAAHKLQPGFLTGYPLGRAVSRTVRKATFSNWLFEPDTLQKISDFFADPNWQPLLAYLTVATEGFLAIGLLWKPTRLAAIVVGIGLHFGIFALMDIRTFGLLAATAYFCVWLPRSRPILVEGWSDPEPKPEPSTEAPPS